MTWRPSSAFQDAINGAIGVLAIVLLIALVWLVVFIAKGRAHSWYPPHCCSGNDCAPLHPSRVWALKDGSYVVDGRFRVHAADARDSQDGRYHACFPQKDNLRCFFRPPSSM